MGFIAINLQPWIHWIHRRPAMGWAQAAVHAGWCLRGFRIVIVTAVVISCSSCSMAWCLLNNWHHWNPYFSMDEKSMRVAALHAAGWPLEATSKSCAWYPEQSTQSVTLPRVFLRNDRMDFWFLMEIFGLYLFWLMPESFDHIRR